MSVQLSGEVFRQIIGQLRTDAADSHKRTAPRVGLRNRIMVTPLNNDTNNNNAKAISCAVRDISVDGIGLLDPGHLANNSLFGIRLPLGGNSDITAVYMVKHIEMLEKGLFRIGAVLLKIDDPEGVISMAKRPPKVAKKAAHSAA
jgi:hypothetical protein